MTSIVSLHSLRCAPERCHTQLLCQRGQGSVGMSYAPGGASRLLVH